MKIELRFLGQPLLLLIVLLVLPVTQAAALQSLADIARQNRDGKSKPAAEPVQPQKSLADVAAERRQGKQAEVKLTEKDVNELLAEMDQILDFASNDTGLARHSPVKHRIVGQADVKQFWSTALAGSEEAKRLARSELVLKKFGYVPREFTMKKYLVESAGTSIAGFYDSSTKTMNLVDWVGLEAQRPIMAHELTHALQDQNFDLIAWQRRGMPAARSTPMRVDAAEAQESNGRKAVIEGQAMVVYIDFLLKPLGRSLSGSPSAMDLVKNRLIGTYDDSLVIHNAPLLFKDSFIFPYREGLMFELELLKAGGVNLAFPGAFARPPLDTHQVLEPKAYLEGERVPPVLIPELGAVLGDRYEPYDTGSMGQLDVRVMSQQFGTENDMFTITPAWKGGSYIAVKRTAAGNENVSTADIALLYVSRWKNAEAAERFAEVYRKSLGKRVSVVNEENLGGAACAAGKHCALRAWRVNTSEGPIFVEIWPNHTVFIAHSFDDATVARLRDAVLLRAPEAKAEAATLPELSQSLRSLPGVQALQQSVEHEVLRRLMR
jgi:hypothetical protein